MMNEPFILLSTDDQIWTVLDSRVVQKSKDSIRSMKTAAAHTICALLAGIAAATAAPAILKPDSLRTYVERFNHHDHTHFGQAISNEDAADWMATNIPLLKQKPRHP